MRFLKEAWGIEDWDIEAQTGYKPITTFYQDFSIAEKYNENAIRDTFNRGFKYAKTDYKVLTEFVMVLNWKLWRWYGNDDKLAQLYNYFWEQADDYAMNTLEGEELSYFLRVTD